MQDLDNFSRPMSDKDSRNAIMIEIGEFNESKSKDLNRLIELHKLLDEVNRRFSQK